MLRAAVGRPHVPRIASPIARTLVFARRYSEKPPAAPSSPAASNPATEAWSQFSRAAKESDSMPGGRKTRSLREQSGYRRPLPEMGFDGGQRSAGGTDGDEEGGGAHRMGGGDRRGGFGGRDRDRGGRRDDYRGDRDRQGERGGWSPRRDEGRGPPSRFGGGDRDRSFGGRDRHFGDDRRSFGGDRGGFRGGFRGDRGGFRGGDRGGFRGGRDDRPQRYGGGERRFGDGGRGGGERRFGDGGRREGGGQFDQRSERGGYRTSRDDFIDRKRGGGGGDFRGGRDNKGGERRAAREEEDEELDIEESTGEVQEEGAPKGKAAEHKRAGKQGGEKEETNEEAEEAAGEEKAEEGGVPAQERKREARPQRQERERRVRGNREGADADNNASAGGAEGKSRKEASADMRAELLQQRQAVMYTDEEVQKLVQGTLRRDDKLRQAEKEEEEKRPKREKDGKKRREKKRADAGVSETQEVNADGVSEKKGDKKEKKEATSGEEGDGKLMDLRRPNNDPDRYEHRPLLPRDKALFSLYTQEQSLLESLKKHGIVTATDIQQKAIPEILAGSDVLLAAETGSGKTLSYGIPVMQFLLHKARTNPTKDDSPQSPDAVIVVPSQELVGQVAAVLSRHTEGSSVRVIALHRSEPLKLAGAASVLVCTPGALTSYDVRNLLRLTRMVVVDEADLLLSGSFGRPMSKVLEGLKNEVNKYDKQFVFVAATVPTTGRKSVLAWFQRKNRDLFGKTLYISTDGLHKTLPTLAQKFDRVESEKEREDKLVQEFKSGALAKSKSVLLFCNTIAAADILHQRLVELTPAERQATLESFAKGPHSYLVCTDLAARGLDIAIVDTVVNYEFPRNVVDYLHRVGRTARAGASGSVLSFVLPTEKVLATFVEETYGQRLEAAFSTRRGFRRRIRRMANEEVGLPDKKMLKDAKRARKQEEMQRALKEMEEEEAAEDGEVAIEETPAKK